ncbi:SDR family oxidoreductase [Nocardioides sp. YIM 152315]|uniref:SDR family oxidoreductase n=1 Tax=Nocardioides sp. YIM 152315 TaxID=3031760 RepID=UPI0023DA41FD|nr:SDR family oxidoreductase [Nocardioides sp. YIM 152315]MDF1602208.1 SDR family oxidoreductase [Nocardioides sp. YIM 152315]
MNINSTASIVTGAASGLGAATATALAAGGAHVFGLDLPRAIERAETVPGVEYLAVDVTDPDQIEQAVAHAMEGSAPLRSVVNCAGIGPSTRIVGRAGMHNLADYARVVQINLIGSFNVLAIAARAMTGLPATETGERGVIINTASVAAYEGQVGQAAYASSKGGIVGLTLPAARDLAQYGIRVNTIAPGILETPMLASVSDEFRAGLAAGIPFPQRLGRPSEYADLALFIIDHEYINGEVIRLDAGLRMASR